MRIGITGGDGLLALHARCYLHAMRNLHTVKIATRETFSSEGALEEFVCDLDGLLHFAGVNRGTEDEVETGNIVIAQQLVASLLRTGARPAIAYANSLHASRNTPYGKGKREAGNVLLKWSQATNSSVCNFILPHIFGEFGKPFYNSVVSTFCYQLACGDVPKIIEDGEVELLHVQAVAERFIDWLVNDDRLSEECRLKGVPMQVSELLARLGSLYVRYTHDDVLPNVSSPLDLQLFNTLRSYLYPSIYPRALKLRKDARGELFEAIRTDQGGQCFLSTTVPGVTRGNHWHLHKIERFLVVSGQAEICVRKLFSDHVQVFQVRGEDPTYIDIPTLHTHAITNVGDGLLQTLFWSNEIFDPAHPDTYSEIVKE